MGANDDGLITNGFPTFELRPQSALQLHAIKNFVLGSSLTVDLQVLPLRAVLR